MMRGLAFWLLLTLPVIAVAAPPRSMPQVVPQAAAPKVKLVPQTVGLGAFDAAAWMPDGRYLLTVSGFERLVRIWDTGDTAPWKPIVDTIALPFLGRRADEKLVLDRVVVAPDGRTARVEAVLVAENPAMGPVDYAPIDFVLDLQARTARIQQSSRKLDEPAERIPGIGEVPDIDAGLPVLPAAPDGRRLRRDEGRVLALLDRQGQLIGVMGQHQPPETRWVTMSPDGATIAFLSGRSPIADATFPGRLMRFDVATGRFETPEEVPARMARIDWLSDGRLLLSEASSASGRRVIPWPERAGPPGEALLLGGGQERAIPGRCFARPLGEDRLVGAGAGACRHGVPAVADLWTLSLAEGGDWVRLPLEVPEGMTIDALEPSSDGRAVAVALGRNGQADAVLLVDATTGDMLARLPRRGAMVAGLGFLPDPGGLVVMSSSEAVLWDWTRDTVRRLPATESVPDMILSDGRSLLFGGAMSPMVTRIDLQQGRIMRPADMAAPVSGGFMRDRPILWMASANGQLLFLDSRNFAVVAEMQRFADFEKEYFLLRDGQDRYDSNLRPDQAPFRWLVMDKPFQSLGTQTFMRDLYTPDLLPRLLDCYADARCDGVMPAVPDLTTLNRTLPVIDAIAAEVASEPGLVDVTVTVRDGENPDPSDRYGHTASGMHNLKLFRDGVLVRQAGAPAPGLDPGDRTGWRTATRLQPGRPDGAHVAVFRDIRMPTGERTEPVVFSAYAFNEDRVRGEEKTVFAPDTGLPARPRRLFLLSVGVDAYPGGLFRPLRYAVADARAMSDVLARAAIHPAEARGMEVVTIRVEGTAGAPATKADIARAAARLVVATPDDMVVMSFSGHGFTDAQGRFALVPSDVRSDGNRPVMASMITADELASWLVPLDAGAIFVVIDACHSAASVMAGGFRPGPMGDPGLGQLAYDKGVRILSASAPDQYAMEDTALGHGLLTYALIEGAGGAGDGDADGLVTMDELMAYAVRRLPDLGSLAMLDADDGPGLVVEWAGPPVPAQTPKLFDFSLADSPLAVRVRQPR